MQQEEGLEVGGGADTRGFFSLWSEKGMRNRILGSYGSKIRFFALRSGELVNVRMRMDWVRRRAVANRRPGRNGGGRIATG